MINYDYFFSEKNGSFNFNSVLSIKSIDELRADKIKDEMISIIESQETDVSAITKVNETIERSFTLKSVSTKSFQSAVGSVTGVNITNPAQISTGNIVTVLLDNNEDKLVLFDSVEVSSETDILDIFSGYPQAGKDNFGFNVKKVSANNLEVTAPGGDNGVYNIKCYINTSEDTSSSYIATKESDGSDQVSNSQDIVVKISDVIVSKSNGIKSSSTLDSIANDIVTNAKTGYSITKEFKNGIDNTDGYLIKISFKLSISEYEMQYKDIVVKFGNNSGTIIIE